MNNPCCEELDCALNGKFLGEFQMEGYKLLRTYLNGEGKQLRLFYTKFTPQQDAKATVCIVHGFGEHSGRYLHVARFLCLKEFEVHMIDLRGFGYSGGARGCSNMHQLLQDIGTLVHQASEQKPLFLYGHCLGALCCLLFTLINPQLDVAGLICTSPLLVFPTEGRFNWLRLNFLKGAGKVLEDFVINSIINPTALTKKTSHVRDVIGDRLSIPFLGLNMASSIIQACQYLRVHTPDLKRPILLLHGKQDTVVSAQETVFFHERCGSTEKTLKIFENGLHELQHDEECQDLQDLVYQWLHRKSLAAPIFHKLQSYNVRFVKKQKLLSKRRIVLLIIFFIIWHSFLFYRIKKNQFIQSRLQKLKDLFNSIIKHLND